MSTSAANPALPGPGTAAFDTLIRGGDIVDGSGAPATPGDIGIRHGRIAAIGDLSQAGSAQIIDARGRTVAPGFIDVHTHDDRAVLETPHLPAKVSQGVTTVITGNCGVSLAPLQADPPPPLNLLGGREWYRFATFGDYLDALREAPAAVNVAPLVGHSTLRAGHLADTGVSAGAGERRLMCATLVDALEAGAIGLSSGLAYPIASAASSAEVTELAAVLHERGAIYTTHMRDEGDHVVEAVTEALNTGARARVPVVISHHKVCGRRNWGRIGETLAIIEQAQRSQAVAFDVYPYTASSTVLLAEFLDRAERVLVTWSKPHPECGGRELAEIASAWGCDRLAAAARLHPAGAIYFQMDEADLQRALRFPGAMIGSDGLPHDAHPHPRLWGTFPRVLGHYCRDLALFPLAEAVHRMTGRPAGVFGLADRGLLREGCHADVVIFDPATIADRASFEQPTQPAAGIDKVLVNGITVWAQGAATGARPGQLLARH